MNIIKIVITLLLLVSFYGTLIFLNVVPVIDNVFYSIIMITSITLQICKIYLIISTYDYILILGNDIFKLCSIIMWSSENIQQDSYNEKCEVNSLISIYESDSSEYTPPSDNIILNYSIEIEPINELLYFYVSIIIKNYLIKIGTIPFNIIEINRIENDLNSIVSYKIRLSLSEPKLGLTYLEHLIRKKVSNVNYLPDLILKAKQFSSDNHMCYINHIYYLTECFTFVALIISILMFINNIFYFLIICILLLSFNLFDLYLLNSDKSINIIKSKLSLMYNELRLIKNIKFD